MYKLLLCLRYLRTRYIALASIVSVMLGVATMIVVNSVMAGFALEMQDRIHGILSDLVVEIRPLEGVPDADYHMAEIRRVAGEEIAGMTPTVVVPAMLTYRWDGEPRTRQVTLIGIDEKTQSQVSDFGKYLQHPRNREKMSFVLHNGGYDTRDHQAGADAPERPEMKTAGWERRRIVAANEPFQRSLTPRGPVRPAPQERPDAENPFGPRPPVDTRAIDKAAQQRTGLVMGIALASVRTPDGMDHFLILPGDDVKLAFPTTGLDGAEIGIARDEFTVVELYECKMSEYDANFVFVPIEKLQEARGMIDPTTGVANFNSIQIKLKPGVNAEQLRDKLQAAFPVHTYGVHTWRDKQGPLLAAVHMEMAILNVLLFMIIAVSGFGILAIFFMIVVEKTRDIGILKSLGASGGGIMGIFLSYGLSLGLVGSGIGLAAGLLFVHNINGIADLLGTLTGQPVFDPSIYYFYKIPTATNPWTVAWIVMGAVTIAVLASVLPAFRAATLHPVEALGYE